MNDDPRPKNKQALIDKFRVVKPEPITSGTTDIPHPYSGRTESVTSGLEPYTGTWDDKQVAHLLRRTLFGVKKTELANFKSLGLSASIDAIVKASPKPTAPINDYNGVDAGVTDPTASFGETWTLAPYSEKHEGYRIQSLKSWIIKNFINQEATIHEKMILFWHNLLVTQSWDVFHAKASYQYFEMLRRNALGNYKTMIKELTLEPAMLLYLNGTQNKKDAPNENYGRELQELFCFGKGIGSQYTESDVKAAARVLTGWQVNYGSFTTTGEATHNFLPSVHDSSSKQFSTFFNNNNISGIPGNDGAKELDQMIDMFFATDELSKYICRRLYSFFVYNEIDSEVEKNVIEPLAKLFKSSNYEILPVLKALFNSAHFFDELNIGVLIKSPIDFVIGTWRTFNISTGTADLLSNYRIYRSLLWNMASYGLEIGDPPNVAGWPAYYQSPQYDRAWITTNTITSRGQTTDALINYGFWITSDIKIKADYIGFVKTLNDPGNPINLINEAARLLLGYDINSKTVDDLKSILLSGQQSDYYWTNAWSAYIASPSTENKNIVQTRLQYMFQRMLQLGEFQLM
jgi:uncharacterized protein (DUF1800 family)